MKSMSMGVIGGADGPTAVFVTGPGLSDLLLIAGIIALIVAVIQIRKRKKK